MRSVLVYRIGQLGDTLMALPALWAVRKHFAGCHVTTLSEYYPGKQWVRVRDVLEGSGITDEFMEYPASATPQSWVVRSWRAVHLLLKLRLRRFDTLVYLAPSRRTPQEVARDRRFFSAAGIRRLLGFDEYPRPGARAGGPRAEASPREADLLLRRLAFAGIPAPSEGAGCLELGLGPAEETRVAAWLSTLPPDGGRPWIAIGPGAKQPVKRWPLERYGKIGTALIERFDVWPVVFGGSEDKPAADLLIHDWKRGYNAAGALDVRAAIAAMRRCKMYLGNDTGVMHMAATAGIRCVAVFASHGPRGVWNPYGNGHRVFRTRIDCEGCLLEECRERASECIMSIATEPVLEACTEILGGGCVREAFQVVQ